MSALETSPHHARLTGFACILFSVLVWAGWMLLSSYGVRGSLTAYDLTALRFGTAGLVLLPTLLKRGLRLGPWGFWGGPALAMAMGASYNTIAILGMKYAPTAHLSMIMTAMLSFTTLGGIFLLRERTTKLRLTGIAISIAGVACLLSSTGGTHSAAELAKGHALFILAGSIWAAYALMMKAWKLDALHATAAVCVYSALLYLPVYFLFLPSHISLENWQQAVFQAGYQGVLNSVFALLCFNRAIALLGAATTSAFLPLIPVIATVGAIPLLGDVPGGLDWLGITLATAGVLLSSGIVRLRSRVAGW